MLKRNLFQNFIQSESSSGILLIFATDLALLWANCSVSWFNYSDFWQISFLTLSFRHWINDGLMAIFFLLVGLEIKVEFCEGELASRARAFLPVIAAIGGMVVPAFLYFLLNRGHTEISGWGIPMATDIAFALGVITALGNRVPTFLKVFLTALAIVDDLGAVFIIAIFYTNAISWVHLCLGALLVTTLVFLNSRDKLFIFLLISLGAWICFLHSGVHATVVGLLLALVLPIDTGKKVAERIESWVHFGILPIFALANAGVELGQLKLAHPVSLGILFGLIIGKPLGITAFSWLTIRFGFAELPAGIRWKQFWGMACLGGIGFTMSMFITNLSFAESSNIISVAKLSIFIGSVISAILGFIFLSNPCTGRIKIRVMKSII